MLQLQNAIRADDGENSWSQDEGSLGSGENCFKDERLQGTLGSIGISPYVFGDLQILSLGNLFPLNFLGFTNLPPSLLPSLFILWISSALVRGRPLLEHVAHLAFFSVILLLGI